VGPTVLINECLGLTDGMEVGRVLGETFKCCLGVDHRVQALRHRHLHGVVVVVLVWFIVFVVAHVQLLCRAQIVAQNGQESSVMMVARLHLTGGRPPE
jgi:hypothetical protein